MRQLLRLEFTSHHAGGHCAEARTLTGCHKFGTKGAAVGMSAVISQGTHNVSETAADDWYCARCIFRWEDGGCYEERLTLWRAESLTDAIRIAEVEAAAYARQFEDCPLSYAGLAQACKLDGDPGHGAEVFSLLRGSDLEPDAYLSDFFDTGQEHQSSESADTIE